MSPLRSIVFDTRAWAIALAPGLWSWLDRVLNARKAPPPRYDEFRSWLTGEVTPRDPTVTIKTESAREYEDEEFRHVLVVHSGVNRTIVFKDCFFDVLAIAGEGSRVRLVDCHVQKLQLFARALEDLHIERGTLLSISAPVSYLSGDNPFRGRVTVREVYIPRSYEEIRPIAEVGSRESAVYEFRNARNLLSAKNDVLAASVFHGVELSLERQDDRWSARRVGWIYEILSDYGNSTARPLWALMLVIVTMATIVGALDLVEPTSPKELYGWQEQLKDKDIYGRALRGVTYTLQSIFNPLGLLASKPLLVAKHWASAAALMVTGLLGTLTIAMFFLALRRRFKLE